MTDDEFLALQARINGGYEAIWKARKTHGVKPGESLMEHLRTCDCDVDEEPRTVGRAVPVTETADW